MQWKNYRYDLTKEGVVLTEYLAGDETTELLIPDCIDGYPVIAIGEEAFSEHGSFLERIEVPSTVRRIGKGAFKMCMSLTELILHEGLTLIEEDAFYLTPMEVLTLPDSVQEIRHPWELGGIRFLISEKNPRFVTDGYGLYKTETEKELLVIWQQEKRTTYTVMEGTTVIGENAVAGNTLLQKVVLPDTVHTIRAAAFEGCQNLREVVFPECLREIEINAFSHCISLRTMHLPSHLEVLGEHAISDTFGWSESLNGLEQITVDEQNPYFYVNEEALFQRLPERAEAGACALVKYFGQGRRYQIPEGVVQILPSAFRRADLHRIDVPESVKDVGRDAFRECKHLEEIYLEESDTLLYVPGQPIYRKDEITALFCSREREEKRQNLVVEEIRLPKKWQSFARMPIYSRQGEQIRENPYVQYVFDYRGYDALFHTYLNLPDQYGMAVCRLKYPVLLGEKVRRKYEDFLEGHLMEILESLAATRDLYHLAALAELGLFTSSNIEEVIDVFNRSGRTQQMSFLLNYKRDHLADTEFDFCL